MQEIYPLMLLTGLTGGFGHCLGMCGPVVASYSVALPARSFVPHMLYHAGRLTTYMLLGGLMGLGGAVGQGLGTSLYSLASTCCPSTVSLHWLAKLPLIVAGGVIIAMGLGTAGFLPLGRWLENFLGRIPFLHQLRPFLSGQGGVRYLYPMGMAMGFIPCGLVYSSLLATVGSGLAAPAPVAAMLNGMSLMLLFGVGTAVPLLLFGKIAGHLGARARQRFYRLSGLFVVAMGVVLLARAFH